MQVCCAWDLYITMGFMDPEKANSVHIPSVFVTMAEGNMLREEIQLGDGSLKAKVNAALGYG
ncbi:unnamed protein product [Discosporangium mesarthrocarpum]